MKRKYVRMRDPYHSIRYSDPPEPKPKSKLSLMTLTPLAIVALPFVLIGLLGRSTLIDSKGK